MPIVSFRSLFLGACVAALMAAPVAQACTGIEVIAKDGSVIHARTLEFGIDLESTMLMIPRGYARTGTTPDGTPGKTSVAKYASVGMNALGMDILVDGVNEKGLAVGLFYFPGSAGFMPYTKADAPNTVADWELGSYLLENTATVDEARAALKDLVIPEVILAQWKFAPEVHFVVRDTTGTSIVVEVVGGEIKVHDAPLGVITNSPTYDWHMTNLRNYVNLSPISAASVKLGSVTLTPTGQGSGMLGLPGDFTPPSRFVRAAAFTQSLLPSDTGTEAVLQAFHVLNNFDIPKGAARDAEKDANGNIVADHTIWTSAIDLKTQTYFFRTYDNSQIRSVVLSAFDLDAKAPVSIPITGAEPIVALKP